MTPAEQLSAARSSVVGPYIPATEALLKGWVGPGEYQWGAPDIGWRPCVIADGTRINAGCDRPMRLDLTRPEVQDHLVRRGAPEWARKLPEALWVWATTGKVLEDVLKPWEPWYGRAEIRIGMRKTRRCTLSPTASGCWEWGYDVVAPEHRQIVCATVETGPEGMACADVAALSRGCILEESDGWLLPLPDGGGVGFWSREGA